MCMYFRSEFAIVKKASNACNDYWLYTIAADASPSLSVSPLFFQQRFDRNCISGTLFWKQELKTRYGNKHTIKILLS